MEKARNADVLRLVRVVFLGAALLFLINIFLGFDNALTPPGDVIPRWQGLMHLHAGVLTMITRLGATGGTWGAHA